MITQSISKNSLLLGLFAIITTGASVVTYDLCQQRIIENQKRALESRLTAVLPSEQFDNDLLHSTVISDATIPTGPMYLAFKQKTHVGTIIPTRAPDGYGGPIDLLVGIYADGTLSGVRVLPPHLETPGLGDAIDPKKSDWILGFTGKSLSSPPIEKWQVKKDGGEFDQFTGATITPRAVVRAVKNSLLYYQDAQANVLQQYHQQTQKGEPNERAE